MMRSIITIVCGLTALTTSAMAADLPVKAPPPPAAPVYNWTGCYIGGNVGWARTETKFRFGGVEDTRHSSDGFAGGGQIGCDYQFGQGQLFGPNWVIGIQGMIDAADFDHDERSFLFPANSFHHKTRWFGTVTGRLGYLVAPSLLFYGKGGWGTVEERFGIRSVATGLPLFNDIKKSSSGADAGVGFEWMINPAWSLWVEWDHIFLQDKDFAFTPIGGGAILNANVRRDFDKVLVGINWRIGASSAPVRASY
jgi:outer membrane immunogenic protein